MGSRGHGCPELAWVLQSGSATAVLPGVDARCSPDSGAQLDVDQFPLVVLSIVRDLTDRDVKWMMSRFDALLAAGRRYGLVIQHTMSIAQGISPVQRRMLAQWEGERADDIRRVNVCSALVLRSAMHRGILTAYRWVAKPSAPQLCFASYDEAERWVCEMLAAEGSLSRSA